MLPGIIRLPDLNWLRWKTANFMLNDHEHFGAIKAFDVMGHHIRAGHARQTPIGDRMIEAVRGAIWEAWEMGLESKGQSIYPSIPLLDRMTEPQEPEI